VASCGFVDRRCGLAAMDGSGTAGCRGRGSALISLDDLPVVAAVTEQAPAARQRKPTKGERDRDLDYGRAMGVRRQGMEFHLVSLLRHYTLDEVIERWWQAQVTR
jgi:hypothetical protein